MESSANKRMKALVAARLLRGDIASWEAFANERAAAAKIQNRRVARSAAGQIGRNYRELRRETEKFISENFDGCSIEHLAALCDRLPIGVGLHLPIAEFEAAHFRLTDRVKRRVPGYAHVSVSPYGLQFEYPEHHFLRDLEAALQGLIEVLSRLAPFRDRGASASDRSKEVADLVGREKFLCRSIFSAAYRLVESFLPGLLFGAVATGRLGDRACDPSVIEYARTKERSASMRDRLDKVVRATTSGARTGAESPFHELILMKPYRDTVHHTTPFRRGGAQSGGRLDALYEIDPLRTLSCASLALDTVIQISDAAHTDSSSTAISEFAKRLRDLAPMKVSVRG